YYPRGSEPVTSVPNVYEILQDPILTDPGTGNPYAPQETTGPANSNDLVLNDVISMDIRLLAWEFIDGTLTPPAPTAPNARFLDLFDSDIQDSGASFFNNYVNASFTDAYLNKV